MRTNEERIAAMHDRAAKIEQEQRNRRVRLLQCLFSAAAVAVAVLLAVFLPKAVSFTQNSAVLPGNMQASIFNGSSSVGYIVIAVIAFLLGAFVTVFCFRLKKWQEKKNREEDHDRND